MTDSQLTASVAHNTFGQTSINMLRTCWTTTMYNIRLSKNTLTIGYCTSTVPILGALSKKLVCQSTSLLLCASFEN